MAESDRSPDRVAAALVRRIVEVGRRVAGSDSRPRRIDDERAHARALLSLLAAQRQPAGDDPANEPSWIHRRSEHLVLLDDCSLRRRWTIEFELPPSIAGLDTAGLRYVPLGWVSRGERTYEFDLRDEDGRPLAVVSPRESAHVATTAIEDYALHLVGMQADAIGRDPPRGLHDKVMHDIGEVVRGNPDALWRFTKVQVDPSRLAHCAPEDFQRAVVMSGIVTPEPEPGSGLAWLFEELERSYLLSAVLPGAEARARRRVLTLAWTKSVPNRQTLWTWIATRMAWAPTEVRSTPRNHMLARDYVLETRAPSDDLELGRSRLYVGSEQPRDEDEGDPALLRFTMSQLRVGELRGDLDVEAEFELRAARVGLLPLALFTCALSTTLLTVGFVRLDALERQIEGAATLLLVIPGLLSLYVVRPGEHRMASTMFSGVRCMVLTATGCVLGAGLLLLVDADPGWRTLLWASLLSICTAASLAVAGGFLPIRTARRRRPVPAHAGAVDGGRPAPLERGVLLRRLLAAREPAAYAAAVACWVALTMYTLTSARALVIATAAMGVLLTAETLLATICEQRTSGRRVRPRAAPPPRRGAQATAIYAVSAALCAALALWLTGGPEQLGPERRLLATIERADRTKRLDLSAFAKQPWTELRVFAAPTTRPAVLAKIGVAALADVERIPESVEPGDALVVLLDDQRVGGAFAVSMSHANLSSLTALPVNPTTEVCVNDGSPPSLTVRACR